MLRACALCACVCGVDRTRWRCRAAAQEPLPRRDHPHRDVTPGAHAAPGRVCPSSKAASHPLPWRPCAPCQAASRDHSILWAPSRPHPCAWHGLGCSRACRSTPIPPQPTTPRRPLPWRRCAELGPVAQTGIRDRHRAVSAVRRHLEAHRRHRRSPRDRQDPHAPRLVRLGTAPIARAAIRPIPNGLLIPGRAPPGSTPRADSLLWPALAREAKTPRIRAPRTDEGPTNPDPGPTARAFDNPRVHPYSSSCRKMAFEIPSAASGRNQMVPSPSWSWSSIGDDVS